MARYKDITAAEMTPGQRRVHDLIVAGRRGRFGGPFQLLIRAPEICEHAAKLGEHLRWETSLPDRLSELAIITTAQFCARSTNGTLMPLLPGRPASLPRRLRPSAAARRRALNGRTRRSSIVSVASCSRRGVFRTRASTRRSQRSVKPA